MALFLANAITVNESGFIVHVTQVVLEYLQGHPHAQVNYIYVHGTVDTSNVSFLDFDHNGQTFSIPVQVADPTLDPNQFRLDCSEREG